MSADGYTTVLRTTNVAQGEMLAELLQNEGIAARFHASSSTVIGLAPHIMSMTVDVPDEDEARARELLRDLEADPGQPEVREGTAPTPRAATENDRSRPSAWPAQAVSGEAGPVPARRRRRYAALVTAVVLVAGAGGAALLLQPLVWWRARALRPFGVTCTAHSVTVQSAAGDDREVRFDGVVLMARTPHGMQAIESLAADQTIAPLPARGRGELAFDLFDGLVAACNERRCHIEADVAIDPPGVEGRVWCAPDWNDWTAETQGTLSPRPPDGV
jgi:Putative prokaryotic signal transducing protein